MMTSKRLKRKTEISSWDASVCSLTQHGSQIGLHNLVLQNALDWSSEHVFLPTLDSSTFYLGPVDIQFFQLYWTTYQCSILLVKYILLTLNVNPQLLRFQNYTFAFGQVMTLTFDLGGWNFEIRPCSIKYLWQQKRSHQVHYDGSLGHHIGDLHL